MEGDVGCDEQKGKSLKKEEIMLNENCVFFLELQCVKH